MMKRILLTLTTFFLTLLSLLTLPGLTATVKAQDNRWLGDWQNVDAGTRGITKLNIQLDNQRIRVQVWSKGIADDCPWGTTEGFAETQCVSDTLGEVRVVTATFLDHYSVKTLFLRKLDEHRLQVELHTRFPAGSGRAATTQTFVLSCAEGETE